MRSVLGVARVLGLLGFLAGVLVLTVGFFPWMSQTQRGRQTRRSSQLLLAIAGVRVQVAGVPVSAGLADTGVAPGSRGRMVLANHVSWADIFAINAALPARFVAKAEIGRWPGVGWVASAAGTLYIERGRRHAVASMNDRVAAHLKLGETVAVFPEGTTTAGDTLLPFHSNLVAPAIEVGAELWPVAVSYTEAGRPSQAAAYIGEMTLLQSLWQIVTARKLVARVSLLPAIATPDGTRHALTEAARMSIAAELGLAVEPRRRAGERARDAMPQPQG